MIKKLNEVARIADEEIDDIDKRLNRVHSLIETNLKEKQFRTLMLKLETVLTENLELVQKTIKQL